MNNSVYAGLLTDRYELTMLSAALRDGTAHRRSVFELFARRLPDGRRYGVVAGTGRFLEALPEFRFDDVACESLAEFLDPSCVKALRAREGEALYFSRAPVPWPRDNAAAGRPTRFAGAWRHVGIYAYRVRSLLQFASWPPTPLEETEKLEQLRALEHGMRIHLVELSEPPPAGVDTPEDLERVRAALAGEKFVF